jgi:hypothetical protein
MVVDSLANWTSSRDESGRFAVCVRGVVMLSHDLSALRAERIGIHGSAHAREDLNHASHCWSTRRTRAIVSRFDRKELAARGHRPTVFLALRSPIDFRQFEAVSVLCPMAGPKASLARNGVAPLERVRLAI